MVKAVQGFREPLAYELMWYMAVVACGDGVVAGLLPTVVLLAHDVAIHTRTWVIREVRSAVGVIKRVPTHAEHYANQGRKRPANYLGDTKHFHSVAELPTVRTGQGAPRTTLSATLPITI